MNIHEYQAKGVLASYGVPVLRGKVAFSVDDVTKATQELGGSIWVVKAQIHAGGRGKAGGVVVAKSADEATAAAERILGKPLVTHQTGPKGQVVHRLYVEEGCSIGRELYLSLVVDRKQGCIVVMASQEGGVDIEEVASKTPEKIITQAIDPAIGYQHYHGRKIGFGLGLSGPTLQQFGILLGDLIKAFEGTDSNLLEINPLVVTTKGDLVALDAKMTLDDNGLFRHPDLEGLRDESEEEPAELLANKYGLSYVKLDGTIGCMVNGAGLAMSTMDIIKLHGGEPANFLDVGGGATQEKVSEAFKIILADPHVKGILINIFGGIMRCDVIAEGIVAAAKGMKLTVPMVVRLQGTNRDLGKKILSESGLSLISADDLADAASKVVQAVREVA